MIDSFWDTFGKLKYDYLDMVVVIVTKMDRFIGPSMDHVEKEICEIFKDDIGVDRVVFSCIDSEPDDLLDTLYEQTKVLPLRQLEYTDIECTQYFGIKKTCFEVRTESDEAILKISKTTASSVQGNNTYTEEACEDKMEHGLGPRKSSSYWRMFSNIMRILCCVPIQNSNESQYYCQQSLSLHNSRKARNASWVQSYTE